MNNYLVINEENKVVNVIVWDGLSPYPPELGCTLEPCSNHPADVWINWKIVDGEWVAPPAVTPSETSNNTP